MYLRSVIDEDGVIKWFNEDNQLHREDGPAIEYPNGDKHWFMYNRLHRLNGPAIPSRNGNIQFWYLNGIEYSEKEYKEKMRRKKILYLREQL